MCGIWCLFGYDEENYESYYNSFMKIKHRGPDFSDFRLLKNKIALGFHRLSIIDNTDKSNQPIVKEKVYLICNGEIYNYKKLEKEYNLKLETGSDCEVIIELYLKIGIEKTIKLLDGEFAFIIIDCREKTPKIIAAKDPIGVRPLFYGINENNIGLCSEIKGLSNIYNNILVFPPGKYLEKLYNDKNLIFNEYYNYKYDTINDNLENIYENIKNKLINSVEKRLMSDQPIGCLLSGGLDSSIITTIANKLSCKKIEVFTISFEEGTDLPYAKSLADENNIKHHIINISPEEALSCINETIYAIESYDITTVRASTMQYLVGKYIKENTDIKVLLCGELADEVASGYLMFHNAPNEIEMNNENIKLVKDVHMFDGLRTDRTMAYNSLEIRLPFADTEFIDYYLSIDPKLRMPKNGLEKHLLRQSFKNYPGLPDEIRLRIKNAFSDSVSKKDKSWYLIIQEYIDNIISDEEFLSFKDNYEHCTPYTKESYYYRKKFCEYFGDNNSKVIPYFWLPKWSPETKDPSARTLINYKE